MITINEETVFYTKSKQGGYRVAYLFSNHTEESAIGD